MKYITFKIAIIAVICVVVTTTAVAQTSGSWTNPGSNPPQGNVLAPIHVGETAQTKAGILGVSGITGAFRLFDRVTPTDSWAWYASRDTNSASSWLRLFNYQDSRDQITVDRTGMRLFGNLWAGGLVTRDLQVTGGQPAVGKVLGAVDTNGTVAWVDVPTATSTEATNSSMENLAGGSVLLNNPMVAPNRSAGTNDGIVYSGTFTVPEGVTNIKVKLQGAGGGVGYQNQPAGAGGYCVKNVLVVPGTAISYSIGTAGAPWSNFDTPSNPGKNGGNTSFLGAVATGGIGGPSYDDRAKFVTNGSFSGCDYGLVSNVLGEAPVRFGEFGNASKNGYILVEWSNASRAVVTNA